MSTLSVLKLTLVQDSVQTAFFAVNMLKTVMAHVLLSFEVKIARTLVDLLLTRPRTNVETRSSGSGRVGEAREKDVLVVIHKRVHIYKDNLVESPFVCSSALKAKIVRIYTGSSECQLTFNFDFQDSPTSQQRHDLLNLTPPFIIIHWDPMVVAVT